MTSAGLPYSGSLSRSLFPSSMTTSCFPLPCDLRTSLWTSRPAGPFASMSGAGDGASAACTKITNVVLSSFFSVPPTRGCSIKLLAVLLSTQCGGSWRLRSAAKRRQEVWLTHPGRSLRSEVRRTLKLTACHSQSFCLHLRQSRMSPGAWNLLTHDAYMSRTSFFRFCAMPRNIAAPVPKMIVLEHSSAAAAAFFCLSSQTTVAYF